MCVCVTSEQGGDAAMLDCSVLLLLVLLALTTPTKQQQQQQWFSSINSRTHVPRYTVVEVCSSTSTSKQLKHANSLEDLILLVVQQMVTSGISYRPADTHDIKHISNTNTHTSTNLDPPMLLLVVVEMAAATIGARMGVRIVPAAMRL